MIYRRSKKHNHTHTLKFSPRVAQFKSQFCGFQFAVLSISNWVIISLFHYVNAKVSDRNAQTGRMAHHVSCRVASRMAFFRETKCFLDRRFEQLVGGAVENDAITRCRQQAAPTHWANAAKRVTSTSQLRYSPSDWVSRSKFNRQGNSQPIFRRQKSSLLQVIFLVQTTNTGIFPWRGSGKIKRAEHRLRVGLLLPLLVSAFFNTKSSRFHRLQHLLYASIAEMIKRPCSVLPITNAAHLERLYSKLLNIINSLQNFYFCDNEGMNWKNDICG